MHLRGAAGRQRAYYWSRPAAGLHANCIASHHHLLQLPRSPCCLPAVCTQLGKRCVSHEAAARPCMADVVLELAALEEVARRKGKVRPGQACTWGSVCGGEGGAYTLQGGLQRAHVTGVSLVLACKIALGHRAMAR